jgi:transcriptional/translational regulatory protein YebC/TACO1
LPINVTELSETQVEEVQALLDELEEDDDVQHVFHTMA